MSLKLVATPVAVLALACCLASQSFAIGLPKVKVPGGGGEKAAAMSVDETLASQVTLVKRFQVATLYVGQSLVDIQSAIGNKAEAEKLQASLLEVNAPKQEPAKDGKTPEAQPAKDEKTKNASPSQVVDLEKVKVRCDVVNTAGDTIAKTNLNEKMNRGEATKFLGKSLLNLGAALLVDTKLVDDAKTLLDQTNGAIKTVTADPMQAGRLKELKSSAEALQFVLTALPKQISTIQGVSKGLIDYAKTNNIPVPSKEETDKQAADMPQG
jgi:hypothetical protein